MQTPLHLAVLKRQPAVIKQLLGRAEVSLTFQDHLGNTPLHLACTRVSPLIDNDDVDNHHDIIRSFLIAIRKRQLVNCLELRNYDGKQWLSLFIYHNNNLILSLL